MVLRKPAYPAPARESWQQRQRFRAARVFALAASDPVAGSRPFPWHRPPRTPGLRSPVPSVLLSLVCRCPGSAPVGKSVLQSRPPLPRAASWPLECGYFSRAPLRLALAACPWSPRTAPCPGHPVPARPGRFPCASSPAPSCPWDRGARQIINALTCTFSRPAPAPPRAAPPRVFFLSPRTCRLPRPPVAGYFSWLALVALAGRWCATNYQRPTPPPLVQLARALLHRCSGLPPPIPPGWPVLRDELSTPPLAASGPPARVAALAGRNGPRRRWPNPGRVQTNLHFPRVPSPARPGLALAVPPPALAGPLLRLAVPPARDTPARCPGCPSSRPVVGPLAAAATHYRPPAPDRYCWPRTRRRAGPLHPSSVMTPPTK